MDVFARSLVIADKIITDSQYGAMRAARYASFDEGKGADFEAGKLTLEDMREIAAQVGEPEQISGKQELLEFLSCLVL